MSLCCTQWPAVGSIEQENRIQHPGSILLKQEVTWGAILTEVRCSPWPGSPGSSSHTVAAPPTPSATAPCPPRSSCGLDGQKTWKRRRWLVFWRTSGWCFNKKMQHRSKKNFNRVKIFNMSRVLCELYIDKHFNMINTKVGLNLELQTEIHYLIWETSKENKAGYSSKTSLVSAVTAEQVAVHQEKWL